jgi:hypothetical protein
MAHLDRNSPTDPGNRADPKRMVDPLSVIGAKQRKRTEQHLGAKLGRPATLDEIRGYLRSRS